MKTSKRLLEAGITVGVLLMLTPTVGLLLTAYGMMRAFNTLGTSGISDPHELSHRIGFVLIANACSVVLCPLGVILFFLSLVFLRRLRRNAPPPLPPAWTPEQR